MAHCTCICCSITSETSTHQGSRVRRHGRSRALFSNLEIKASWICLRCADSMPTGCQLPSLTREVYGASPLLPVRACTRTVHSYCGLASTINQGSGCQLGSTSADTFSVMFLYGSPVVASITYISAGYPRGCSGRHLFWPVLGPRVA